MQTVNTQDTIPNRLLWVDCEFTGLDLNQGHKIIEIGAMVTNLALEEIETYQAFIDYDWAYIEAHMAKNPWWTPRVNDKERMRLGNARAVFPGIVDAALSGLVSEHFPASRPPLCGNSVSNDKKHIDVQFPNFAEKLSYQIIDVSSLKLVAKIYRNVEYDQKVHRHFALDDIRESVDEFKFLLGKLGVTNASEII